MLMYRMKGGCWNRENHYPLTPDENGEIAIFR